MTQVHIRIFAMTQVHIFASLCVSGRKIPCALFSRSLILLIVFFFIFVSDVEKLLDLMIIFFN